MGRRYRGSITAQIEVDDLIGELSDSDVRAEFEERFGKIGYVGAEFDLLAEIQAELVGGRVNAALALVESAIAAQRVSDEQRQSAYQAAGRAH